MASLFPSLTFFVNQYCLISLINSSNKHITIKTPKLFKMDPALEELNRLASSATAPDALSAFTFPSEEEIQKWQALFNYNYRDAASSIVAQRQDVTRERITDEHWELVREGKEKHGHDRETYEHELALGSFLLTPTSLLSVFVSKCE